MRRSILHNNNLLPAVFSKYGVLRAYTFGSVNTSDFNMDSDIDFIIEFDSSLDVLSKGENWWNLYYELKEILKRDIDLITPESITNRYFRESVEENKQLIYEKK